MFNLDEAIKHCEEIAMDKTNLAQTLWDSKEKARCEECASEHRQLAEWLRDYKRLKEQQSIVTSTKDNAEMTYPQVEGITPTVVKPIGDDYKYIKSISNPTGIEFDIDISKEIESYGKLLKHPVVKHIMDMDEEQEQIDFVRPHKKIPVTLTVSGYDKLIDLANAIESDDSGYWTNKKISSALRNISSIKPQLCEDTISRQAVMDYIHRILNQGTGKKKSFEFIQKYVEKLPSIKPQVQTGHWEIANSFCTCDQCGYETRPWNNTLFCPNCGVRMESEKNE